MQRVTKNPLKGKNIKNNAGIVPDATAEPRVETDTDEAVIAGATTVKPVIEVQIADIVAAGTDGAITDDQTADIAEAVIDGTITDDQTADIAQTAVTIEHGEDLTTDAIGEVFTDVIETPSMSE